MSMSIPLSDEIAGSCALTEPEPATHSQSLTPCELVQAIARASLLGSPYREVQKLHCTLSNGVILLRGQVSTFYMKQVAQSLLMKIEGVSRIVNSVHVRN
jgi:BON domain